MGDSQNPHLGVSGRHVHQRVRVSLRPVCVQEGRFINEEHTELDACPPCLDVGQAKGDGQGYLHLFAAAVGLIGPVPAGDGVNPDFQAVDYRFRALLLALGTDVNGHSPACHGGQDVVALPHNLRDYAPDNHVLNTIQTKGLSEHRVIIQGGRCVLDVPSELRRLRFGLGDRLQLGLDDPALGSKVGEALPAALQDGPQALGVPRRFRRSLPDVLGLLVRGDDFPGQLRNLPTQALNLRLQGVGGRVGRLAVGQMSGDGFIVFDALLCGLVFGDGLGQL